METLKSIWQMKVEFFPLLLTVILQETIFFVRRWIKVGYTPLYFAFFPLTSLNKNLAIYLGEHYHTKKNADGSYEAVILSDEKYDSIKNHAKYSGLFSIIIAAIVVPSIIGFISAFYLPYDEAKVATWLFILIRLPGIAKTIQDFGSHAISSRKTRASLVALYILYIAVYIYTYYQAFDWTYGYVSAGKVGQIFSGLFAFVIGKVVVNFILLGGFTVFVVNSVADKSIHSKNINEERRILKKKEIKQIKETVVKSNPKPPPGPTKGKI